MKKWSLLLAVAVLPFAGAFGVTHYDCTVHIIDHTTNGVEIPLIQLEAPGIIESAVRDTEYQAVHVFSGDHGPKAPGTLTLTAFTDAGQGPVTSVTWDGFYDISVEFWGDASTTNVIIVPSLTVVPPHLTHRSYSGIANVPAGHTLTVDVWTIYGFAGTIIADGGIRGWNAATNHWHGPTTGYISGQLSLIVKDGSTTLKTLSYYDNSYSSIATVFAGDYNSPSGITVSVTNAPERTVYGYIENSIYGWPASGHDFSLSLWTKYGFVGVFNNAGWQGTISGPTMLCESVVYGQVIDNHVAKGPVLTWFWTGEYDNAQLVPFAYDSYSNPDSWDWMFFEW